MFSMIDSPSGMSERSPVRPARRGSSRCGCATPARRAPITGTNDNFMLGRIVFPQQQRRRSRLADMLVADKDHAARPLHEEGDAGGRPGRHGERAGLPVLHLRRRCRAARSSVDDANFHRLDIVGVDQARWSRVSRWLLRRRTARRPRAALVHAARDGRGRGRHPTTSPACNGDAAQGHDAGGRAPLVGTA